MSIDLTSLTREGLEALSMAEIAAIDLELRARSAQCDEAARKYSACGAEAIGILRALDEHGLIPEVARDQVLDVLTRHRDALNAAKAAAAMK